MTVRPILEADLDEVGRFLHEHLARRISPQAWSDSLRHRWAAEAPNHGMQLFDGEGRRVGVLLAVYSDQWIAGRRERFCNPHSWCVLDEHRHASIQLVLAVLRQRGYHFTMFTPNPKVTQVFAGLRFRTLDATLYRFANLPGRQRRGEFVECEPTAIAARLRGPAAEEYAAHRDIPWLRFVAFGRDDDAVLAIYKPGRWKRMGCARLLHLSDFTALERHGHLLRRHLLGQGMPLSQIEGRWLARPPRLALRGLRGQPKMASSALTDAQIRDVYSELMTLDI